MAKCGPKPKNLQLKMLEGSRIRKPVNTGSAAVEALKKLPPAPARYGAAGRQVWRSEGHRLIAAGILAKTDTIALELLTDATIEYAAAQATTDRRRCEKASKWLLTISKEFGLSPASRRGVATLQSASKAKAEQPSVKYFL